MVRGTDRLQALHFVLKRPQSMVWECQVAQRDVDKGASSRKQRQPSSERQLFFVTVESATKRVRGEPLAAQLELISNVRITDTLEPLDTLTVSQALVAESDKFFELCERCVGSNFLRVPLSFSREEGRFKSNYPAWFEPAKPTSMAEWILFFVERAIWLQFKAVVEQHGSAVGKHGYAGGV